MNFTTIEGGICAPQGFSAAGIHCGIRHNHAKPDLALIDPSAFADLGGTLKEVVTAAE